MNKTSVHWEMREVEFLIKNWGKIPIVVIAEELGRTVYAVKGKRAKLGLPPTFNKSMWTEAEEKYLIENWEKYSLTDLSSRLNQPKPTIKDKAKSLGLPAKAEGGKAEAAEEKVKTSSKSDGKSDGKSPEQRVFDLKPGDRVSAPYISKTAEYRSRDGRKEKPRLHLFTVVRLYPHIFQARLEETEEAGLIVELSKNDYIAGTIKKVEWRKR